MVKWLNIITPDGSMYGRLMLTKPGYIDVKCFHIWHTWFLWPSSGRRASEGLDVAFHEFMARHGRGYLTNSQERARGAMKKTWEKTRENHRKTRNNHRETTGKP